MRYKNIPLDFSKPFDSNALSECAQALSDQYPFLGIGYLGKSILGVDIPYFILGEGKKEILYVGAHHGMEWITSLLLVRFLLDACELAERKKSIHQVPLEFLLERYTLYVLPMLNPDGVGYQIHGVDEANPLYGRLISMNGGSTDFSRWQANARGVDLNHNYDAGFWEYKKIELDNGIENGAPTKYSGECPESEPEVAYLCNFIRFHENIQGILTLHTQGEEIFYQAGCVPSRKQERIAKELSALTDYRLSRTEGSACFGGLTDWCVQRLGLPSYTLECGKGENPLPLTQAVPIYARLRRALFRFPLFF
ncbi:MAG: peptidase M14 [Clostridia bacterium]|nr:peptidase M14 [Clostridia bacterium]